MPNILAHSHITASVLPEHHPDVDLGSVIKDFAEIYHRRRGRRVLIRGINNDVDEGIALHTQTDIIFDSQDEKPQATGPLSAALIEAGIPDWPARLTADFATDVLLDRALLDVELATLDFRTLGRNIFEGRTSLDSEALGPEFASDVIGYFKTNRPANYRNPHHIAALAFYAVNARSEEAGKIFGLEKVPIVSSVLAEHADRTSELGLSAMEKTIKILRTRQELLSDV